MLVLRFPCLASIFLVWHACGEVQIEPDLPSQWIKRGKSINITCIVVGIRDQSILWKRGDNDITNAYEGSNVTITKQVTKKDGKVLFVLTYFKQRALFSDTGNYTCAAGRNSKTTEILVTEGRLKIRPNFGDVVVSISSKISLVCEYEGHHMLPVTWFKEPIHREHFGFMTRRWTVKQNEVKVTIEIEKQFVTKDDEATYQCVAGPYSKSIAVHVHDKPCRDDLITKSTPSDKLSASSFVDDQKYYDGPSRAYLDTVVEGTASGKGQVLGGAWQPVIQDKNQWIQAEFAYPTVVIGVSTKGRSPFQCCNLTKTLLTTQNEWVTAYHLEFSKDGIKWLKFKDLRSGEKMIFPGNTDRNTEVRNQLPIPILTKFMRILPQEWHGKISLRFEVHGCEMPSRMKVTHPKLHTTSQATNSRLKITCDFFGAQVPKIHWLKNEKYMSLGQLYVEEHVITQTVDGVHSLASLTKDSTTYEDAGTYTCVDEVSNARKDVDFIFADLELIPSVKRLWIMSGDLLNISCYYKGAIQQEITWSRTEEATVPAFLTSVQQNKIGKIFFINSVLTKRLTVEDSSNITCSVQGFTRTIELRVITVSKNQSIPLPGEGSRILLPCEITGKFADVKVQVYWTKNNIPLSKIPNLVNRFDYNIHTHSVIIKRTEKADAGHYECNIMLDLGSSSQKQITIPTDVLAPVELKLEGPSSVVSGEKLDIFCRVSGYPVPPIDWYLNGIRITDDDSKYHFQWYNNIPNGHMTVLRVKDPNDKTFECKTSLQSLLQVSSSLSVRVNEDTNKEGNTVIIALITAAIVVGVIVIICIVGCIIRIYRTQRLNSADASAHLKKLTGTSQITRNKPYTALPTRETRVLNDDITRPRPETICLPLEERTLPKTPDRVSNATFTTFNDTSSSDAYEKYEKPLRGHTRKESDSLDIR